jgi:small GTP-binding protein
MILSKCIVIGDSGIGKSAISEKYFNGTFDGQNMPTIGIEFFSKILNKNDKQLKIQLWDTAGQERFKAVSLNYYRDAVGALVCFSILNKNSFDNIPNYLIDIDTHSRQCVKKILVGTFSDLDDERKVTKDEAVLFAKKHDMEYIEVSAVTGLNINECFDNLFGLIVNGYDDGSITYNEISSNIVKLNNDMNSNYKCCF